MKPSVFFSTVVCGLLALPAVAAAQDQVWLRDRRYTEGAGYRVGDFELHPGAAAEFGYDSNYLRRAPGEALSSLRLRLTPSFSVSTLGRQRQPDIGGTRGSGPAVEFRGGASLTYNEFFPLTDAGNAPTIRAQRNVGAAVDLGFVFLPGRPWSGALNLSYMRALNPTDQGIVNDSQGASQLAFNRNLPRGSAELIWTPGAGLFEWRLGYSFSATLFEATEFSQLTNLNNALTTRGRWRFLPRTAFVYDASFGFITYTNPATPSAGGKLSSHPMRARLGVNGLITPSFALLAMAGWGASFYTNEANAPNEDFDSVIGQLELKWFLTPNLSTDPNATSTTLSSIAVGFTRDFHDSYIGNFYERDRGYLAFSFFYGGKFLISLDGGAGPVIYPKMNIGGTDVPTGFTDIRIDASLFAEYRFMNQLGVNTSVRYNQNINKQPVPVPGVGDLKDSLSYQQIEAYLGVRWLM